MTWIANNASETASLLARHAAIALPAIAVAVILSIPVGWAASRRRRLGAALVSGLELLYAIPSLALFILVPAVFGIGLRSYGNALAVLAVYGVAVLVRPCTEAFDSVPADVRDAADACGYSPWRRFWAVELPLSLPICVSGIRVMAVSTISLVTVGSVIGIQSLGTLFTDGFQRGIMEEVAVGLVLTVALAVVVDLCVVGVGRLLTPWTRSR
ncbi:ABC transporter permease subunit [Atopobiaceae bacterium 24-176]